MLKRFVIERELKGIGAASEANLGDAAQSSNGALAKIDGVQWEHSYVTADKTFCIYLAESSELIREHAKVAGLPASCITEIVRIIDPTTEQYCTIR